MTTEQEQDMQAVWGDTNGAGFLDYVTGWYVKAAQYIQGTRISDRRTRRSTACQKAGSLQCAPHSERQTGGPSREDSLAGGFV
jgi:hypothetical protein